MTLDQLKKYCLSKSGTTSDFPFDFEVLTFRVAGKMFALCNIAEDRLRVNLKCDPGFAEYLRKEHAEKIIPGYHMNKQHWNTVYLQEGLDEDLVKKLIDDSYELVFSKLPKKVRESIRTKA